MMTSPFISVVVPIYNVEKYLGFCIDSILMQSMKDFEIILVDDGSPDGCGIICDEYAAKHENVYAFHKKNGGLSDARNFGLKQSRGKYVLFIDSDDFYDDSDFFKKIKSVAEEFDNPTIIAFSFKNFNTSTGEYTDGKYSQDMEIVNGSISCEELLKHLVQNDKLAISACFKAIKREFMLEHGLFFKKGIYSEDIEWSMRLFTKPLNMKFLDSNAYVYRSGRDGSITNSMKMKNLTDLMGIIEEYSSVFLDAEEPVCSVLLNYLAYQYCILCGILARIKDKKDKAIVFRFLKDNKWLLKYSLSRKVAKVAKLNKYIGIRNTVLLLGFYIKHRG